MKPIIYIDMLFLLNFLMNTVTVYLTSLYLRKPIHILRLFIVSTFGATYSSIMFFPQFSALYSVVFKLVFWLITVTIAFPGKTFGEITKNAFAFFAINLIFGASLFVLIFGTNTGTILGSVVSNGEIYINFGFGTLLFSSLMAYITIYTIAFIKKQNVVKERITAKISIQLGNNITTVNALCDTGCTLCDPLTGAPAIIVAPQTADKLLKRTTWNKNYRFIPYSTITGENSFMSGFIPDRVYVNKTEIFHTVIAVSENDLPDFQAIFNPDLFENTIPRKAVNITNEHKTLI